MAEFSELAGGVFLGNPLGAWIIAVAQFALWFTVLPLARAAIAHRLKVLAPEQSAAPLVLVQALLGRTTRVFLVAVALYLALRWLTIPAGLDRAIAIGLQIVIWVQAALWATTTVRHLIERRRASQGVAAAGEASLNILRFVGITAAWVIASLMLLANLGIEIMPLVAGLGIGGIAVALAVQNVLGDLLASLSIALDKPFRIGDFLIVGEEKGTVEYIGIKSTRLRSLSGEQIVISNGDLLRSRVRNYGLLYERRVVFQIGIVYETPFEQIVEVPRILEAAIRAQPKTRFDRAHFASHGDFSLNFEAVYFVLDAAYNTYMDIQQAINLQVHAEFAHRGIEFAYPTAKQYTVQVAVPGPTPG